MTIPEIARIVRAAVVEYELVRYSNYLPEPIMHPKIDNEYEKAVKLCAETNPSDAELLGTIHPKTLSPLSLNLIRSITQTLTNV